MHATTEDLFGPEDYVFQYSRQDAIENGDLVEINHKSFGIPWPTVLTSALWQNCQPKGYEDLEGVLWDLFHVMKLRILNGQKIKPDHRYSFQFKKNRRLLDVVVIFHLDDNHQPCCTLMLPNED